ncbi:helix-turn-helix transcriptional regulator [Lipingzhangella sp. LS1_29]|uniref:Helix-turn-helix transcriptional regulator n=1 Tax=Lipingzhangella rawalii TaxID=2055835 RepID=A0ABU2H8M0_9ACTN|nr:helix-turn-helix transcriptional regulator [Lipingzhangella rawalii]MDS1271337.1 helix-turn-helix transcriptional regulator [Lipingzhangella rawalii]
MAYAGIRHRRLGSKLAELRKRAALKQTEVTEQLGWNQATLARYERGERVPKRAIMSELFALYDVSANEREEVMTLYRLAERPSWWYPYRDLLQPEYAALIDLEADAAEIRTFEILVPGLFQTPDYARHILQYGPQEISTEEVERRLELRMARQEILDQADRPRLLTIMDEGALGRAVGGRAVMHAQIDHLLQLSRQARTSIQVVPYTAGAHPGASGSFTLIDCAGTRVVYVDTMAGQLYLERSPEVTTCSHAFEQLLGFALNPNDSADLMRQYLKEYT